MATFYGISSDSVSTLFSSMGNASSSRSGSLNIDLSQYASIKNGSYYKVSKKYFENFSTEKTSDKSTNTTKKTTGTTASQQAKEEAKQLNTIKSSADQLAATADKLEDTKVESQADVEGMVNQVSDFVKNYNATLKAAKESDGSAITSAFNSLKNTTAANENTLGKVGITVNKDSTLKLDESVFKNAKVKDVKNLFSGKGSYAYSTEVNASYMSVAAKNEATNTKTYTDSATFKNIDIASAFEGMI